ncbi:rbcL, partial [Symbiodinium sp. CCMP2456]
MAQRPSNLALAGAAAGGLALLGSATAFVAAPQEASAPSLRGASVAQSQAQAAASGSSLSALAAGGAVAAAAVAASRPGRQTRSTILPTTVVPVKESRVTRKALDQSSRYADLSLDEATLIKNGKHVLVAYIMKPKAGYDYLATAAHFAAESSTGTNVNVCTTDDFTKSVDALVYYIDPDSEEMKLAYPNLLFDRNII